uniref:Uncharacterized protein n=1 Tax=Meloidogyne javanica TaxID=6303 RepID=A0A915LW57_MELJA
MAALIRHALKLRYCPKFKGLNFRQELERLWQLNEHKGEGLLWSVFAPPYILANVSGVSIDSTSGASERMDSSFEASTQNDVPGSDSSGGGGGGSLLSRIKSKFSKAEVIDAEEDAKMSEENSKKGRKSADVDFIEAPILERFMWFQ